MFYYLVPVNSITNMKFWGSSEAIISKTLQLLSDLSVGYPFVFEVFLFLKTIIDEWSFFFLNSDFSVCFVERRM